MSIVWPTASDFPQAPLVADYSEDPQSRSIRTIMDAGEPQIRPVSTKQITHMSVGFYLTDVQKVILKTFYDTTCKGGSERFDWIHPDDDSPIVCRFLSRPQYKVVRPGLHKTSFDIEVVG